MKKLIIILVLIIYTLIIFVPPIAYDYVYPNNGDDSGNHLTYFKQLQKDDDAVYTYVGQYYLGEVIIGINQATGWSINSIFLWINFFCLWLVGIIIFIIAGLLFGWFNGLITIPIVVFMQSTVLNLFDDGSIFDLATVAILVPLMLFILAKILNGGKVQKIICSVLVIVIFILAVATHSSAIFKYGFGNDIVSATPFSYMLFLFGYWVIALGGFVIWNLIKIKPVLSLPIKVLLYGLGIISVGLAVFAFTKISIIPLRFSVDLAIIMVIIVAFLTSIVIKNSKSNAIKYIIVGLVVLSSIPNLVGYLSYNSAIKPIDKQAIEYINQLDGQYYSCEVEINPFIYNQYLNKTYKEGELPFITRSKPMTANSTVGTKFNWRSGYNEIQPIGSEKQIFSDGNIVIEVYYK